MPRANAPIPRVLHALLAQGGQDPTHESIAETAGVSERTVAKVVSQLKPERLLTGGHPARLGPGLGLVLGVSLGAESLRAGIVDAAGELYCEVEEPPYENQLALSPEELLSRVRLLAASVLKAALENGALHMPEQKALPLLGVAVAWPSAIDRLGRPGGRTLRHGLWSQHELPGSGPMPLTARTAKALGPPFAIERCHALNDADADALAVAFDQARSRAAEPDDEQWRVALIVRVGGRLGASTITLGPHRRARLSFVDARLISGTDGFAGELGHLPIHENVIDRRNAENPFDDLAPLEHTAKCYCGHPSHLQAFASAQAFVDRLAKSGYDIPHDGRQRASLVRSALAGEIDHRQSHALHDAGRILGGALASPILMLNPHSITLTGSLARQQVRDGVMLEEKAWKSVIGDRVKIRFLDGKLAPFSGVRGAALAVIRRSIYRARMDGRSWPLSPLAYGNEHLEELERRAGVTD